MERVKGIEPSSRFPLASEAPAAEQFRNLAFRAFRQPVVLYRHFLAQSGEKWGNVLS